MLITQKKVLKQLEEKLEAGIEELSAEEQADYDELMSLVKQEETEEEEEEEEETKTDDVVKNINNKLEEIGKWIKTQNPITETQEIPAPQVAKPNREAEAETTQEQETPLKENKLKAILKKIW